MVVDAIGNVVLHELGGILRTTLTIFKQPGTILPFRSTYLLFRTAGLCLENNNSKLIGVGK